MEDTTTSGAVGAADAAQPTQSTEAVSLGERGAPVLRPSIAETSPQTETQPDMAAPDEPEAGESNQPETQPSEAQANIADDLAKFAQAKGFDPATLTDGERKALEMARNAEKRMHEATAAKTSLQPPEMQEQTGDAAIDDIIERQNGLELRQYVRDWFEGNPEAKQYRSELQAISNQRPWLTNMDDVYAHLMADPSKLTEVRREAGREALTNLAQKQSAVPPQANASTGTTGAAEKITPENVDQLVGSHNLAWFAKNKSAIDRAMSQIR